MIEKPLVSCIMPTANRESFIPLAIKYFQRQDYPNLELIILDDGINSVQHLLPNDNRINYIRLDQKPSSVGLKRNQANSMTRGEIIMHWDDDDWYAPSWVSFQVNVLQTSNADICGLRELFFYSPSMNKSWKYIYPLNERPWVAGATMAYKKEFWQKHPFQNIQVGEDNHFVWFSQAQVIFHSYLSGFVSILHLNNTSPKYTNNVRWVPCPVEGITQILNNDFAEYLR